MFGNRRRVEEDLERIRKANLPEEMIEAEKLTEPPAERIGGKDILAMIIAAFSVIVPYVLIFMAVMAAIVLVVYWLVF